jgi:hypothetical protein
MTAAERKKIGNSRGGEKKVKKGFASLDPERVKELSARAVAARMERKRGQSDEILAPKWPQSDLEKSA